MSHEVVRPGLHAAHNGKGRVVRFEDLVDITKMEPLQLLRTFGPLSSTATVEGGIATGGGTSWCRWHWFIFAELKLGREPKEDHIGTYEMEGEFDSQGNMSWPRIAGRRVDAVALLNTFVPAGWAERLCAVWEVGIRSLKLEGAHGMTCALNHTLLHSPEDEAGTMWCLRGYLADGALYEGRNPIRA